MKWPQLYGNDEEEEESFETEERREEFIMREEFTRKTVRFEFIRGGSTTITYDEFDGRLDTDATYSKRFSDGKYITERGDIRVEQFCKVVRGHPVYSGDRGHFLQLYGEKTGDEVTTSNVASRHVEEEIDMVAFMETYENYKVRTDTGEEVKRSKVRHRDDDAELITDRKFEQVENEEKHG